MITTFPENSVPGLEGSRYFDLLDLVTVLSAFVVMLHSPYTNEQFTTSLGMAAILIPPIRRFGPFWIGIFVYRFVSQVPDHWQTLDNHQYLFSWWCLGLGLALMTTWREESIRILSWLMIGLCFLFAVIWKLRSPDFLFGDFLAWRLTTDSRLREFAEAFLRLPENAAQANEEA